MTSQARFELGFQKTVRWTLFTDGVTVIIMGALGALNPALGSPSPAYIMGIGLLVSGANYLVPYFALKKSPIRPKWFMLTGAVDSVFGVLFLTRLGLILFKFPALAGIWMIFVACVRGYMAFENFRAGIQKWWITLTVSGYMLFASAAVMTVNSPDMSIPSWSVMIVSGTFIINEGRKLFRE